MSLIDEHHGRRVRMGHLAFVGSHKVNGVSALHTELMRETVFQRPARSSIPDRIVNKTNGITFRRWLHQANPGSDAAARRCDRRRACWTIPTVLGALGRSPTMPRFSERFAAVKRGQQGARCARIIAERLGISVDPDALFDVQIKRIHEYKRQLLNILETIALYNAIRAQPDARLGAARQDLRRQGGGELPPGQAHHQARSTTSPRSSTTIRPCAAC